MNARHLIVKDTPVRAIGQALRSLCGLPQPAQLEIWADWFEVTNPPRVELIVHAATGAGATRTQLKLSALLTTPDAERLVEQLTFAIEQARIGVPPSSAIRKAP